MTDGTDDTPAQPTEPEGDASGETGPTDGETGPTDGETGSTGGEGPAAPGEPPSSPARRPRRLRSILIGTAIAVVVGVLLFLVTSPRATTPSGQAAMVGVGSTAPDFTLPNLLSTPAAPLPDVHLYGLGKDRHRPVVLNFYASWCIPCRAETPMLASVAKQEEAKGSPVQFVGVNVADKTAQAVPFTVQAGVTYPVGADHTLKVNSVLYGLNGEPNTFFIDEHGVVIGVVRGQLSAPVLQSWLHRLAGSAGTVSPTTAAASPAPTTTGRDTAATGSWWSPPTRVAWQWELEHPLDLTSASDMGTGATDAAGHPVPNPTVYDIDGFTTPAATVSALHAQGDRAVCYVEVGAAENYRPDYHQFPADALGATVPGYPAERYLDITDPAVEKVVEARIAMCAAKGFDAVEPDIDDSYNDATGFHLTQAENIAYDTTLAAYAHARGLGWALKNGDDPTFATAMEPVADFVVDEQCYQYGTCGAFAPFQKAGKSVLEVEYSLPRSQFCPRANAADINAMAMKTALDGGRQPCR